MVNLSIMRLLKNYPLTILTLIAVFYLSLFTPPDIPELQEIRFIDKWTHLCMYGGLSLVIFYEHFKQHGMQGMRLKTVKAETLDWKFLSIVTFWFPFLLGGSIEIIQENCTGGRRGGDWIDWVADGLGSLIAFLIVKAMIANRKRSN